MKEDVVVAEVTVSARARARKRALANPAFAGRMWRPGQSGNPTGAIGEWQLCREHSAEAAQEIIRLFAESYDDRVRYLAAQWVYEQAWGKPRDFDPTTEREPASFDATKLTADERAQVRAALLLVSEICERASTETGE